MYTLWSPACISCLLCELNTQNSACSPKYEEISRSGESSVFLYQNCGLFHKSHIYRQTQTCIYQCGVSHSWTTVGVKQRNRRSQPQYTEEYVMENKGSKIEKLKKKELFLCTPWSRVGKWRCSYAVNILSRLWLFSFMLRPFYLCGKAVRFLLNKRMGGLQWFLTLVWEEINLLAMPGIEPLFLGFSVHSLDASNTEHSLLLIMGRNG